VPSRRRPRSPRRRPPLLDLPIVAWALGLALLAAAGAGAGATPADAPRAAGGAARARAAELVRRGGPWTADDARGFLALALDDAERFAADPAFRVLALERLAQALPGGTPAALRDLALYELESGPGLDFAESEALELAWGAAPRASAGREIPLPDPGLTFADELRDPVAGIVFSFPTPYVEPASAERLLAAVRRTAPEREIVVLADLPMRRRLETTAAALGVHLVETFGRPYSPWPRDPFSAARTAGGRLALIERPAAQEEREEDLWMAREVVQNLPPELDRAWGGAAGVAWARAPFYFHNGQVLMAGGAAWTSIHGLERRTLEILELDRVPVESFATAAGLDRYLAAARRAMAEMAALYGKPVRLVHPLPEAGDDAGRAALMGRIGGGAGYDLDSVVTLLPGPGPGSLQALVADLDRGRSLLAELPPADWSALGATYGLAPPAAGPAALLDLLAGAQETPRAAALDAFLDLVAEHLAGSDVPVRRLPLLLVPVALLQDRERFDHDHFLVGWNNVVPDARADGLRAEGFASGVPTADERARAAYRAAGVELELLPPLRWSVVSNGGYRCASNEIRALP
jgi:hypothetical protein